MQKIVTRFKSLGFGSVSGMVVYIVIVFFCVVMHLCGAVLCEAYLDPARPHIAN